jgi:hypothetical protein
MSEIELQTIYLNRISEALARLDACTSFLEMHKTAKDAYFLDAAVLQVRKSMESLAFAAIAPNRAEYEAFRASAEKSSDFRKDYNARAILQYLGKINPDFYPTPLLAPIKNAEGIWHFERKTDNYLTKKQFESFYDRLGKYLHADNPWGDDKVLQNLKSDLPGVVDKIRTLLEWHFTVIRTPHFNGIWVIEANGTGAAPHVIVGKAEGDFVVQ